ncbi:hypothetical protein ASD67_17590 [Sphingopyxis sp. Root1497]|uniref:DUF7007 domain-containing protein n=1 Tax=Sphingopyxis sp. Root1497 TaxID=1736474 RepID=UPI0006FA912B|nr:hypothetical protein [Sphingopyxis sp. Root1497]KQZ61088.1 hypothetical protein ASD67_17590 [Sphingopyxis sp. Root1497]
MTVIVAEYGTTADGLWAARIDDLALIAIPIRDGYRLATASARSKPISEWSAADGFGFDGQVADEAGFRAHVEDCALHVRQRALLARGRVGIARDTPWGPSQTATRYAEGIICFDTASHGGFFLDEERNAAMHPALRLPDGWYEEDCDWALAATGYPDLFTDRERRSADRTLRDWHPGAWEGFHGRLLGRCESFARDREGFERDHAADWIVISATRSPDHPGYIVGIASLGGHRGAVATGRFLIPQSEYESGRHGFVIDPARHLPAD